MLVLSIFRVAVPSLVFGEHSWDTGFCRVGCVFAMPIDGRFDATSRRSSRAIRQSLLLTISVEINGKSIENRIPMWFFIEVGLKIDLGSISGSIFPSGGCFWELLGDFGRPLGLPWATLGRSRDALGGSWASPGAPRGPSGDPPGTLLGSREPRGLENHHF